MAQQKTNAEISEPLLAEIEKIAQTQGRPVNGVLDEAVSRYLREKRWASLKSYGREKARERGLTDEDVQPLIEASRRDVER